MSADSRRQRLRLIGVVTLVGAPHLARIPAWVGLFAAAVVLWQALAAWRDWPPPGRFLRLFLASAAFTGVYLSFGRGNGQEAGVALLTAMLALKLTETRTHRDVMVLLGLCYFVLITHFLFSQAILMAAYLAVAAWLITACFLDANHPQGALPARHALRAAGTLLLQALPVAALLFVLFPRIPGPLWGLPADAGAEQGTSGLSETMEPGAISDLALSNEIAFRVRFDRNSPPPEQRYWRGPVLWHFDGRVWRRGTAAAALPPSAKIDRLNRAYRHEITLEPHGGHWLPALDMPVRGPGKTGAGMALRDEDRVRDRRLYRALSYAGYRLQPQLPAAARRAALQLPAGGNPRARELARGWRESDLGPAAIVETALRRFREQPFHYSLQPPPLDANDRIDEFLFQTLSGFCEHYAGAFTFLMRAAGVPARVVTGYQGGERNDFGDYLIVRQSDAHAWAEVWLQDRGWVRVDPTAAVSPARIEAGLAAALTPGERPGHLRGATELRYRLELAWDTLNAGWNRWFLAYGPDLQRRFMHRLGLPDMRAMILALTAGLTAVLTLLGVLLLWQARPQGPRDPVQAAWLRFGRTLARAGVTRAPGEGPLDYAARAAAALPGRANDIRRVALLYAHLRYRGGDDDGRTRSRFLRAVRGFRIRGRPGRGFGIKAAMHKIVLPILLIAAALWPQVQAASGGTGNYQPANDLERQLLAAQGDKTRVGAFLEELVDSEVVLLSKRDVVETKDPSDIPALVLPDANGNGEMLAVFTSPQLAHQVAKTYPEYRYGVNTDFIWVLAHTAPGLGIVINPGWTLGMTIPSYGLLRLRERYQARIDELLD